MSKRDNFSPATKERIAKRAGYLCSNPECRCATVGAAQGHGGWVNVGIAAHITAAAVGGPRYDSSLTPEQRCDQSNGIWACQTHAKLIDSDSVHFTVDMLREWKWAAEKRSFLAIAAPIGQLNPHPGPTPLEAAVQELVNRLALAPEDDIDSVTTRLARAAAADLQALKRMPGWPAHDVILNLRMAEVNTHHTFQASGLAAAVEIFHEIAIVAPPGTGKTITLLQVTDAILSTGRSIGVFFPLGEWSSRPEPLLQSITGRAAFRGTPEQHLMLLAYHGRLVLILDGWNELDPEARGRATAEIKRLRRDFPSLGIIASTRREALHIPISGPTVEIDSLTIDQQFQIARAIRGEQGATVVDRAIRTSGIRELISIPLYITALLARAPSGSMPTTKEELLRHFIAEHERPLENAASLREAAFGLHADMLTALAVEAIGTGNTVISDTRARTAVVVVEQKLADSGQITAMPQPTLVLDVLVKKHLLVRSCAQESTLSFQHQQFQEWYASREVEQVMRMAAIGDEIARHRLRVEMLNEPSWEEAILFACERLSRTDQTGIHAVAVATILTLSIDPMLAAEMIYRSSPALWERVKDGIIGFVQGWHGSGAVDRAVRFMILSGRPEFAEHIWPLIRNPDTQIHLRVLRSGPRFRPSVLGPEVAVRIAGLAAETRQHILSEIALNGGMDGIELAMRLAKNDSSPAVQLAVVEALQFRRADHHVADLLGVASPEVWPLLARKGYAGEIADASAADRLRAERQRQIASETHPMTRIGLLLAPAHATPSDGEQIANDIEVAELSATDQHAAMRLNEAYGRYPEQVTSALIGRLEGGRDLPFHAEELLVNVPSMDDGQIPTLALDPTAPMQLSYIAATVVGQRTAGALIDACVALSEAMATGRRDRPTYDRYDILRRRIATTRVSSFIPALLARSHTTEPRRIAVLAELVARHGADGSHTHPLSLDANTRQSLVAAIRQWVEMLLTSSQSARAQLAEVATAIGRLGYPELVADLRRLLDADLSRWRQSRRAYRAAPATAAIEQRSDAATAWVVQYQQSFVQIGDDQVVQLMPEYLEDPDFGFAAACVLLQVWDQERKAAKPAWAGSRPDFSGVAARRAQSNEGPSPWAEPIFAAIERLIADGSEGGLQLAIQLGRVAVAIPHGDKSALIGALVAVPRPIRSKRELLAALVVDGQVVGADLLMAGIRAWIEDARQNPWMFRDRLWEVEGWLELLPFSERPLATIEGVELVNAALPCPHRMERVVSALGYAPSHDAERTLFQLLGQFPQLTGQYEWIGAILKRGTRSAASALIDLIASGDIPDGHGPVDNWWLSSQLSSVLAKHAAFKADLLARYNALPDGPARSIVGRTLAQSGDPQSLLSLVRTYAAGQKAFDGLLSHAIREAALAKRPAAGWPGAFEFHPIALTELRKEWFGMLIGTPATAALAQGCLTEIDLLRDEYGPAESEPRHPDIESGRPWPLAAGTMGEGA